MIFKDELDINKLFSDGFFETEIPAELADRIYQTMLNEAWIELKPEKKRKLDTSDKQYFKRHIAAHSILKPAELHDTYAEFIDAFKRYAEPVLTAYRNGDEALITAYCGTDGYEMELHTDVSDRSVIDVILYIGGETEAAKGVGGTLEIVRGSLKNYDHEEKEHLHTVKTTHGKVIILNNLLPYVYHGVPRLEAPGAKRYQLVGNMGLPNAPKWSYSTKHKTGIINPDKPVFLDDIECIVKLMNE